MKRLIGETVVLICAILVCICMIVIFVAHPCNYFNEQSEKDKMLSSPNRPESIVLLGGSNVIYGFSSQMIEDSLKMNTINDGFHAGLGMKFILENCSLHLKSGDMLILCPEYEHFIGNSCYGEPLGLGLTVLSNPKYIRQLNYDQLHIVAKTIPYYIKTMIPYYKFWDNLELSGFNSKGDFIHADNICTLPAAEPMCDTIINKEYCCSFFAQLRGLESKGVKVFIWPPSYASSSFQINEKTIDNIRKMFEIEGFPPLCDWSECAYPDSLFYDTQYHLNNDGKLLNTCLLINKLKSL